MKKDLNEKPGSKGILKNLKKLIIYFILFCFSVFIVFSLTSYMWLENLKIDQDEMISDILRQVPEKGQ